MKRLIVFDYLAQLKITHSFFDFYIFNEIAFRGAALKPDLIRFFIKV